MSLRIRTNIQSMIGQRHLRDTGFRVQDTTERLSSGKRINKAADDAAGLAISEILRADIRSMGQAKRNANDAVSLIQVAEGGLNETANILIRLRELSIQAASDTIGPRERAYLNEEFFALKDELDRIALTTEFNGTRLLTGNGDVPESMLKDHTYSPLEIQVDKNYIPDVDSIEMPNPVNIIKLDLSQLNVRTEGEGSLELGSVQSEGGTTVVTKQQAQGAIASLDAALHKVARYRAYLGAHQNRLMSTDRNLGIAIENLSSANSRIVDADFAYEAAELTQNSILQQSGAAVLAQANQLPSIALKLLQ